jgi:hypothetical protein
MKRFIFIVLPNLQSDRPVQTSNPALLDELIQLRHAEGAPAPHAQRLASRMEWKSAGDSIGRMFNDAQSREKNLHVLGSPDSLVSLLEHLITTRPGNQRANGEKNFLHLHPVLREGQAAEMQISRLYRLIDSLPASIFASIIHAKHALDTSNRWDHTEIYYRLLVHGEGEVFTDELLTSFDEQQNGDNLSMQIPALHHSFAGIQQGDSLLFVPEQPGEFEQIYRAFQRKRFAPFERASLELENLVQIAPAPDGARLLLSRFAAYLGEKSRPYLVCGSMDDYFFLTQGTSQGTVPPDSSEDRVFIPAPVQFVSGIQEYFDILSNHVDSHHYDGILTVFPIKVVESERNEIFESANRSLIDLTNLAAERGYIPLFCLPGDHQSVAMYQRKGNRNQRIPGITTDELFTSVRERLN